MDQNALNKQTATAEFDAKLSKLYDGLYRDVEREAKKVVVNYRLNLDNILAPDGGEDNKRITRKYNSFRVKMMRNIELMSRRLVATGSVSLFNMYGENKIIDRKYERQYNHIRATLLDRVSVAVSKMRHDESVDGLRISEFLFPTASSKAYAIHMEVLKHKLLYKLGKGIKNMRFYAAKDDEGKEIPVTTQADVPIDSFILPTRNSKYYTVHMEALKHYMLAKVWKGVRNISFYGAKDVDGKHVPVDTKVDVPIDSFLIPTRNSLPIAIQYELIKHKLLKKVKKAVNSIEFSSNQNFDIMEHFMPTSKISERRLTNALMKNNEFQMHEQSKFISAQFQLDVERNTLLRAIVFGGGAARGSGANMGDGPMVRGRGRQLAGQVGQVAMQAAAVAGAAGIGWGIGQAINQTDFMKDLNKKVRTVNREEVSVATWEILQRQLSNESMDVKAEFNRLGGWDKSGQQAQTVLQQARANVANATKKVVSGVSPGTFPTTQPTDTYGKYIGVPGGMPIDAKLDELIKATQANKPKDVNYSIFTPRNNGDAVFTTLDAGDQY